MIDAEDHSESRFEHSLEKNADDPPRATPAVAGLFCFRCGYDLRATGSDEHCPECGLPVATSVSSSMLAAEGVRHGPALRNGLVMLAVSLFMIPVIPWVTLGVEVWGPRRAYAWVFALLVAVEHGLWVLGVWRVSGCGG